MSAKEKPAAGGTASGLGQHSDHQWTDNNIHGDATDAIKICLTWKNVIRGFAVPRCGTFEVLTRDMRSLGRVNSLQAALILLVGARDGR